MADGTAATEQTKLHWKCLDFGWLVCTWPGRFKSVEFITTLLGFVLISSLNLFEKEPRYEFYVFVGVFTWVMVSIHMVLGIPHIIEKLPAVVTQPFVFIVLCSVAVLSWLISSCLVLSKSRSSTVAAGAVFGFISMFLFFFEAIYYFICWKRGVRLSSKSTSTTNKEMGETAGGDNVGDPQPGY